MPTRFSPGTPSYEAQAGTLAALTLTGAVHVWHVLALSVVLGAINAFDMPIALIG